MCNSFTGRPGLRKCKLASKADVHFTVLETYFLLVVYSLHKELKGTAPPNQA